MVVRTETRRRKRIVPEEMEREKETMGHGGERRGRRWREGENGWKEGGKF